MSNGFTDWADIGFFPMQDHEPGVPVGMRSQLAGGRIDSAGGTSSAEDAVHVVASEFGMGTIGDLHPNMFWQTRSRGLRDTGSWSASFASMVVGGGKSAGGRYKQQSSVVLPIWARGHVADSRYVGKSPSWPKCFGEALPQGTLVVTMPGTDETQQQEVLMHADPRIIAPWADGPGNMGTLVCDLQPEAEICMDSPDEPGKDGRHAQIQSMMKVVPMNPNSVGPLGGKHKNSIAWNCAIAKEGGHIGGLMWMKVDDSGAAGPTTGGRIRGPITQPPGRTSNALFGGPGEGLGKEGLGVGDGPAEHGGATGTGPCGTGRYEKKSEEHHGYAVVGQELGCGPISAGAGSKDQHLISTDKDGHAMVSGHLDTNAYFYMDQQYDAPLHFERALYPPVKNLPIKVEVHLQYDPGLQHKHIDGNKQGKWRWWSTSNVVKPTTTPRVPQTPPRDPRTPSTPGVPGPTTPGGPGRPGSPGPGGPTTPGPGTPTPGRPTRPGPTTHGGPRQPNVPAPRGGSYGWKTPPSPPTGPRTPVGPAPGAPPPSGPSGGPEREDDVPQEPIPGAPITPGPGPAPGFPPAKFDPDDPAGGGAVPQEPVPGGDWEDVTAQEVGAVGQSTGVTSAFVLHHPTMESFAAVAFRPELQVQDAQSFRNDGSYTGDEAECAETMAPQTMAMDAFGGTNSAGHFEYDESPQTSYARGGTALGGVMFHPPEYSMDDYFGLNSAIDVESEASERYVLAAPGVAFALGMPNSDGTLQNDSFVIRDNAGILEIGTIDAGVFTELIVSEINAAGEKRHRLDGTNAVSVPNGSTADRPSVPVNGDVRVDLDTDTLDYHSNGTWRQLKGTVASVDFSATTYFLYTHGLGFKPNVSVLDSDEREVEVVVDHPDNNTVILYFNGTLTGTLVF